MHQAVHCLILPHIPWPERARECALLRRRVATERVKSFLCFAHSYSLLLCRLLQNLCCKYELKSHLCHTQRPALALSAHADLSSDPLLWLTLSRLHNLALHPPSFCIVCCRCRRHIMGRNQHSTPTPPLKTFRKEVLFQH